MAQYLRNGLTRPPLTTNVLLQAILSPTTGACQTSPAKNFLPEVAGIHRTGSIDKISLSLGLGSLYARIQNYHARIANLKACDAELNTRTDQHSAER